MFNSEILAPLTAVKIEGKQLLHFEKARVKTQTLKNRGKITIELESKDRNTIAPKKGLNATNNSIRASSIVPLIHFQFIFLMILV